ncbi:LacI family DNA-binding transcriptional regulator [Streptomyces sp. NPDC059076]|uniref:LacI family DNA-binding transcriptional regulator n=1 Tax=unclassified Streptomyces TaxID=2593676 RepID=UPI00369F5EB6
MPRAMSQTPKQSAEHSVPTSADVARLAGVSRATVSYVLNNASAVRISDATRRRVRAAAEELGYVPHAAARSLRAGHTRMVLLPTAAFPSGPLHSRFLQELQGALRQLDYTVVQYDSLGLEGGEAVRSWAELRPVAVVALGEAGLTPQGVGLLRRSGAKAVITLAPATVEGAHSLVIDQSGIGRCAATHLLQRGRRALGIVLPSEPGLDILGQHRIEGARQAIAGTGARIEPLPLSYDEESATALAVRWRTLGLDAVYAYNDDYAMLLMRALQDQGIDIPRETAVIGADDLLLGRLLRPRLSTVHLDMITGNQLAELVDRAVREPDSQPGTHWVMEARAVHRESS